MIRQEHLHGGVGFHKDLVRGLYILYHIFGKTICLGIVDIFLGDILGTFIVSCKFFVIYTVKPFHKEGLVVLKGIFTALFTHESAELPVSLQQFFRAFLGCAVSKAFYMLYGVLYLMYKGILQL